jgi:type II secretory pathway component PulF
MFLLFIILMYLNNISYSQDYYWRLVVASICWYMICYLYTMQSLQNYQDLSQQSLFLPNVLLLVQNRNINLFWHTLLGKEIP